MRAIAAEHPDDLTVHLPGDVVDETLLIDITLNTSALMHADLAGLQLNEAEDFVVAIPEGGVFPPSVKVRHNRFLGFPHVLAGRTLCLYLDPSREWQPKLGIRGLMDRLWNWLEDAVNARFEPSTALYHAVGGVEHATQGTPLIVVRHRIDNSSRGMAGHLRVRSDHRYDHAPGAAIAEDDLPMPLFVAPHDLPFGAGQDRLVDLLQRLDYADTQEVPRAFVSQRRRVRLNTLGLAFNAVAERTDCCKRPSLWTDFFPPLVDLKPAPPAAATALLTVLAASAARQPDGAEQHLLLGVPHPTGGSPHLLGLKMPSSVGDALRRVVRARRDPILNLRSTDVFPDIEMEWYRMSDERDDVTVRRDDARPVSAMEGKVVHVWGCGGLGSWIAEFAVRAGAKKVILCDPSTVTGGLLVRQNYVEVDVGDAKADGLAQRLRAISDDVEVEVRPSMLPEDWRDAASADLVVDATISHAISQFVETLATDEDRKATIAQVATDARTGTLGLAIIAAPGDPTSIHAIDNAAGAQTRVDADLEAYRIFWTDPGSGDELTPTRGCSAPTFHGSAADMAGVAGTLLSVIGLSMQAKFSGTHLTALPHSGVNPAHRFVLHVAPTVPGDDALAVTHEETSPGAPETASLVLE
ncbi:ThiF family adenylyltransferase [Nocardioides sp. NPDC101246]|uniref:ThiF family adenylyltransferase n=1 Tax=Nocardioides sp. NPDC101246 TaxID=3364336 RepID=UPI00380987BC